MIPKGRRKQIRDAALSATVGRFVDEIERALDGHVDQGRDAKLEAKEVLREVVEALAREDLADKVIFTDTGTFEVQPRQADRDDGGEQDLDQGWPDELPRSARESDSGPVEPDDQDS